MLNKGYLATQEDLVNHTSGQLRIDRNDGSIQIGSRAGKAGSFLVRPGLRKEMTFYGATSTEHGLIVAMSDGKSTRFYLFNKHRRETLMIHEPSHSHEESWVNLFKALLAGTCSRAVILYNAWYNIFLQYFLEEGLSQTVAVEGIWKGEEFIASLEWDPEQPRKLEVSATFDQLPSRSMLFAYHPIEALYRACRTV
ncbi:hypothetical protein D3C81_305040 [compost metagenome]